MQHTVHSTVDGGNPAPVTAHSCSRETLSPPRPPNQCCFRGAFRWCRIMSIQLLFLQQRCNPSMLNGGREGCSHPGLRVVHDSFHPPSGETVFSASDGCFFEAPEEDLLVYGCANTSLNQFPFAFAKTSIQTHFHLQSCYPPDKDATDLFYLVYGCANASLNKFPFARAKTPIQTHFHLHSCCPQTKKQHCSICSPCGQKLEIRRCVSCMVHYS